MDLLSRLFTFSPKEFFFFFVPFYMHFCSFFAFFAISFHFAFAIHLCECKHLFECKLQKLQHSKPRAELENLRVHFGTRHFLRKLYIISKLLNILT